MKCQVQQFDSCLKKKKGSKVENINIIDQNMADEMYVFHCTVIKNIDQNEQITNK